jgi:hypothetical protein
MRPVASFRQFHGLSNYIKFAEIGVVDFKLFNFKVCISIEFGIKQKFDF